MDGWVVFGTKLDTKDFDKQIGEVEYELEQVEYELSKKKELRLDSRTISEYEAKAEKLRNKIIDLRRKQEDLNRTDLGEAERSIDGVGNAVTRTIKKLGKMALAIFGIRSAYNAVRNAMSLVESKNNGIATQIEIMKMAIANALLPVIQKILNLVATLMMYINYIAKRLTGKYLFNFTKAFNDVNKSANSTQKTVEKMTAGFDEMNVLSDTSSSASADVSGTGPIENPFKDWENFEPPTWLEKITDVLDWIKTNWQAIAIGLLAIGAGFLIFKLLSSKDAETITEIGTSFTGFFDSLGKGIEAIAILGGLALVIKSVTDLIKEFSESGLEVSDVLGLMAVITGTVISLITALTIAAQFLQSPMAMGGLAVLTASISAILLVVAATLPTILDALGKFINDVGPTLNMILNTIGNNIEDIIIALGTTLPPIINSVGTLFDKVFTGISKVVSTVGGVIVNILQTAESLVTTVLSSILNFINKLGPAINNFVDNTIKAITKLINFMISGIEYMINTLVISSVRNFVNKINKLIPGEKLDLKAPSDVKISRFYPKLAVGGIVNMPGRGVPIGGAITGEAGIEGVVPLTDSQAMETLGATIGRYITINANITNTMNGRVISREIKKINANNDFALNR